MSELELHTYIWRRNRCESEDWNISSWAEQHLVKLKQARSSENDCHVEAITIAGSRAPSSRPYRWWIWRSIPDVWAVVSSYLTQGLKNTDMSQIHVDVAFQGTSGLLSVTQDTRLNWSTHTKKKPLKMVPNHCTKGIPKRGATREQQQISDWLVNDGPGCFTSISQWKNME